ncbi:MAG: DUF1178 family protein [Phenylobacterium sp.]|uniref:DUF1178 family protein n=1 Tax=Phenylobacterium sp. TaxID=1871053 RepID=UPI0027257499|nr:DUF1178 family protein [Phenylobacterium sp.]MDO8910384.1 DUF1178 family protein [Phenylobacterium sp.]MDP3102363.1 DUF1178 family protein [Phenylobacterium sp.]HQT52055.1 DUF1178 family protein [Phenylobacterium sp.]
MIRYALACDHAHEFEGWFGSSEDYDAQADAGQIGCPTCGSTAVTKQIMAPMVAGTKRNTPDMTPAAREVMMQAMAEVRQHVEDNFDYVGDTFADEARAIHAGKSENRGIYGEATPAEVRDLKEEGVNIAPLPSAPVKKASLN